MRHHDLDSEGRFTGYDFHILKFLLPAPALEIRNDRQATFKEELRIFGRAGFAEESKGELIGRVEMQIQKAYDSGETIVVEEIE